MIDVAINVGDEVYISYGVDYVSEKMCVSYWVEYMSKETCLVSG